MLDRAFYSSGKDFKYKPASAVCVCRRSGGSATLDRLTKYFTINQMPVISSTYWNIVHGAEIGEVVEDLEGMQTMRNLARNLAWMMKCFEAGRKAGIGLPDAEAGCKTNFIR